MSGVGSVGTRHAVYTQGDIKSSDLDKHSHHLSAGVGCLGCPKIRQIGPKWDIYGTFQDPFQNILTLKKSNRPICPIWG